ncbi:MAG: hypothetical protein WC461_01760 [Candidatus Paceibacterota bacterium]
MKTQTKIIFSILAIVIIGGGAYGVYWFVNQKSEVPEQVFCTQEALICPDGSYVGRTGPKCEFKACPNQPSFTGILKQTGDGFFLILGSPENSGGDVAYSMPLIIKVSNVVGQLINQKVQVFGNFTEGATLSVDRLEELPGDAGDPTLGEISIRKSVFINGVRITLNKIVKDSRCPIDVKCIQAGWVTTNITLESDTDKETIDVSSNKPPVAFDSYQISIENVKPSRVASATIGQENYLITFRVKSN